MTEKLPRTEGLAPCLGDCGRITKPSRWRDDKAPGIVRRQARGMCGRCLDKFYRKAKMPVKSKATPERVEYTVAGLEAFLRQMRANSAAVKQRRSRVPA